MTQNQDVNRLIIAAGAMKTVGVSIDVNGNEAIITGNESGGGGGGSSEQGLHLTFNLIANCPVQPPTDVAAWNTYLSTDVVQTTTVVGSKVILVCNGQFSVGDNFTLGAGLLSFEDFSEYLVSCGYYFLNNLSNGDKFIVNGLLAAKYGFVVNSNFTLLSANKLSYVGGCANAANDQVSFASAKYIEDCLVYATGIEIVVFPNLEASGRGFISDSSTIYSVSLPSWIVAGDNTLLNLPSLDYLMV